MLASAAVDHQPASYELGLVLSGGGARGFAHIGVLQVIEELQLPVDLVVGVSMGSIIGAGYAAGFSSAQMADLARVMRVRTVFKRTRQRSTGSSQSYADPAGLRAAIHSVFGDRRIEDLECELLVVSASVLDGQPFLFRSGPLVDALVASCSIPLMFPPISQDGCQLLDGGLIDGMPLRLVRSLGVRRMVAVDASSHARNLLKLPGIRQATQSVVRALEFRRSPDDLGRVRIVSRMLHHASQPLDRPPADVLIRPSFGYRTTYHYQEWATMVARGRAAAERARPALAALAPGQPTA